MKILNLIGISILIKNYNNLLFKYFYLSFYYLYYTFIVNFIYLFIR